MIFLVVKNCEQMKWNQSNNFVKIRKAQRSSATLPDGLSTSYIWTCHKLRM